VITPELRARIRKPDARQLDLPERERDRLAKRIEEDYENAISDHERRMARFVSYYKRWRPRSEESSDGDTLYRVPITQWQIFSKLAKEMSALFGADSQVIAKPIGANDQRHAKKIGCFETWRLFSSMRIQNPAVVFNFRKILFGRSIAYAPYHRDIYYVPTIDGNEEEVVAYDGPGFFPEWPDDIIVPAEDATSIQDFSFAIRKVRLTPDQLLRGEDQGKYVNIHRNFKEILERSLEGRRRDYRGDEMKAEKDLAEGVLYDGSLSARNAITAYEWYGRWRRLKGRADAREDNLQRRSPYESDLLIKYIPDMQLVIGEQDLAEMYPAMKARRPFVESALVNDGSYWGPGFGELLERIENELSENHNMAAKAGKISVGPVIFYSPAEGFDPDTFEYEPGMAVATSNPNNIKVVEFRGNLEYPVVKEQTMIGYAERVTGISDMNMGRTTDRPNAPRTARQTIALLEEGDVRASLDTNALREDWGKILQHFWALEGMYAPPNLFFRVTEEEAAGAFTTQMGGSHLTDQERAGAYDFELKFATNAWSKETQKENQLTLYQIDLGNPLIINNPRALWLLLDKVHRAFGDDRFADVVPEPPDLGLPKNPREEWTMMLQGEPVTINPLDNDELHLLDHNRRLQEAANDPNYNQQAYADMAQHVLEHTQQLQQKKLMGEMVSRLSSQLAANQQSGTGLMERQQPMGLDTLQQQLSSITQPGAAPQGKAA
jgi:hypothetical protein